MSDDMWIQPVDAASDGGGPSGWSPVVGDELARFLGRKPPHMRSRLQAEGVRVLKQCVPPTAAEDALPSRAGLVLGYVQSGKTSSFTAVTSLARDNGYQLVVIIAGTTSLLQKQTVERLEKDLSLGDLDAFRRWSLLKNPSPTNDQGSALKALLEQHAAPDVDAFGLGVPLVVVMKQHVHLANLIAALGSVHAIGAINALVVDDEAHMHTPNVGKAGSESATYSQIKALRAVLPRHSLLQYTATPQAPLLASIADELSPEFVCLLEPGDGYTGGHYFFIEHHDQFVEAISDDELYALDPDEFAARGAPPSLRQAFISYLLACASSQMQRQTEPSHSSMLVHPHSQRDVHSAWYDALLAMQSDLSNLLSQPPDDEDLRELLDGEVAVQHESLARGDEKFPPLGELVPHLKTVLARLQIKKVNSNTSADVPWAIAPYWVLVGGNLLGVGFTVEGLRTSHMMRSAGTRLADTIQQRARFFGYKGAYASSCRAWLQPTLDSAFVDYVSHESALRSSLEGIEQEGRSLRDWKRVFLLDPRFQLTRAAARRITLDRFKLDAAGWCLQQMYIEGEVDLLQANRVPVDALHARLSWSPSPDISGDTDATKHQEAEMPLRVLRELLADLRFCGHDSERFVALGILLAAVEEESSFGEVMCLAVDMAAGYKRRRTVPGLDEAGAGKIALHQGRNPRTGPVRYAGDAKACSDDRITLQLHHLDLTASDADDAPVGVEDLPFIAVRVPDRYKAAVWQQIN